jgi:hypothetical protein
MEILDQLRWSPRRRRISLGNAWQRRVEVNSLGWCNLGRRELGTWIVLSVGKACESLSVD